MESDWPEAKQSKRPGLRIKGYRGGESCRARGNLRASWQGAAGSTGERVKLKARRWRMSGD